MAMKQAHISDATTSAAPVTLRNARLQLLIEVNLHFWASRDAAGQWHRGCDELFRRRHVSRSIVGIALREHGLLYERTWGPGGRCL